MLPILLMILKIAGIAVLVILGLLLFGIAAVLLVPVRYSVSGSWYGKPKGTVKITWFLHAVSVKITYEDGLNMVLKVLGKRLFQEKEPAGEAREDLKDGLEGLEEELRVDFVESAEDEEWEISGRGSEQDSEESGGNAGRIAEESREQPEKTGRTTSAADWEQDEDGDDSEIRVQEVWEKAVRPVNDPERTSEQWDEADESQDLEDEFAADFEQDPQPESGTDSGKKRKRGFRSKFRKSSGRKKDKNQPGAGARIRQTADSLKKKWDRLNQQKEAVTAFCQDEKNQDTIRLILRQARAVIVHVLPRKARGKAVFGFEDPAITGKVLAGLSIVYAWYGDAVEIVPIFHEKILELEGSLKGRVRAGTIAARGVRILLNKNFRALLRAWRRNGGRKDGRK